MRKKTQNQSTEVVSEFLGNIYATRNQVRDVLLAIKHEGLVGCAQQQHLSLPGWVNKSPLRNASNITERNALFCRFVSLQIALRIRTVILFAFLAACSSTATKHSLCEQKINWKHFNTTVKQLTVLSSFFSVPISLPLLLSTTSTYFDTSRATRLLEAHGKQSIYRKKEKERKKCK